MRAPCGYGGLNTGNRSKGATGCPSWCRPLHPLFHFLCSILFIRRELSYLGTLHPGGKKGIVRTIILPIWHFVLQANVWPNTTTNNQFYLQIAHNILAKIDLAQKYTFITKPVTLNLGWETSLPVYVPLLPWLSASRAVWLVCTQSKQEMSSLNLNFNLQACSIETRPVWGIDFVVRED